MMIKPVAAGRTVAFVTSRIAPGGGPPGYMFNLRAGYRRLPRADRLRTTFVGYSVSERNRATGGTLIANPEPSSAVSRRFREARTYVSRTQRRRRRAIREADILVAQGFQDPGWAARAKGRGARVGYMPHSPVPYAREAKSGGQHSQLALDQLLEQEREWFRIADFIVFPCREAASPYLEEFCPSEEKLHFIESGVVPPEVGRRPERKIERAPLVVFAGRYVDHKGYDLFLDAATMLHRNGSPAQFVTLGDGPQRRPAPGVKDWGWQDSPHDILAQASMVVVPNRVAYFDLLPLEAAALSVGLVMTEVGGNLAQLARLPDAVGCDPSPGSLATGISQALGLLAKDPDWGCGNAQVFERYYSPVPFATRWERFLGSLPLA